MTRCLLLILLLILSTLGGVCFFSPWKFNSSPLKIYHPKRRGSSSNHHFSGTMFNFGRVLKLHETAALLFAILVPIFKCSTFGRQLSSCRSAEDILDFVERPNRLSTGSFLNQKVLVLHVYQASSEVDDPSKDYQTVGSQF